MKKYATPESVFASMQCDKLAVTVAKGLIALNDIYMAKAQVFMDTQYKNATSGMHSWLRDMTPYWKMLIGDSNAVTTCILKYYGMNL